MKTLELLSVGNSSLSASFYAEVRSMSNGEVFFVAKPRIEMTASGQSDISIVDVWVVPDNGQGRIPTNIDELRGGSYPRQNFQNDQQRSYQPFSAIQHMTLVRTQRGWELQQGGDPRLEPYRVPRISQDNVDPRYLQRRSNHGVCGCSGFRSGQDQLTISPRSRLRIQMETGYPYMDMRGQSRLDFRLEPRGRFRQPVESQYPPFNPRGGFRIQIEPQYPNFDRGQSRIQIRQPGYPSLDPRGQYVQPDQRRYTGDDWRGQDENRLVQIQARRDGSVDVRERRRAPDPRDAWGEPQRVAKTQDVPVAPREPERVPAVPPPTAVVPREQSQQAKLVPKAPDVTVAPRAPELVPVVPPAAALEQPRVQEKTEPRVSPANFQREFQAQLQRMSDEDLQQRYDILMRVRQQDQARMQPRAIDPNLSEVEYKKQHQIEKQRRENNELQRKADAELQRAFETEIRRRNSKGKSQPPSESQADTGQKPAAEPKPLTDAELQQRAEVELRRRADEEIARAKAPQEPAKSEQPQQPQWTREPEVRRPPQVTAPRPQGRATYGVDPGIGSTLEQRNQQMRREVDVFEEGVRDKPQWTPKQKNLRTWEDNLDFDKDGTKIKKSVGDYLGKYGPPPAKVGPDGKPIPLTPQGIIENKVDSTLRSLGDFIRGK
jgi:hypothetical protein